MRSPALSVMHSVVFHAGEPFQRQNQQENGLQCLKVFIACVPLHLDVDDITSFHEVLAQYTKTTLADLQKQQQANTASLLKISRLFCQNQVKTPM